MEVGLLGPLEVRSGAGPVARGGGKRRARVALDGDRVGGRERLIDGVWGEEAPESAVKLVEVYVWQLRKVMPEEAIVTRAPGYVLAVAPGDVDLIRFEGLVDEARAAAPT